MAPLSRFGTDWMTIEPIRARRRAASAGQRLTHGTAIADADMTPQVRATVTRLAEEVESLRRELERAQDRLAQAERAADQDQLLPVLNRRAFTRELARQIGLAARYGTRACLLYVDLDGFKQINDTHGHACGDAVLAHFAAILVGHVRDSDVVGRLGGDEFGVILAHAGAAEAGKKADALLAALSARPPVWNGTAVGVGFSCGVFELVPGETADSALMRADEAMYARKRAAR